MVSVCVCLPVCLLDTTVSPAKTDEPIEVLFGTKTWVGARNHVLSGGPDSPEEATVFEGHVPPHCKV